MREKLHIVIIVILVLIIVLSILAQARRFRFRSTTESFDNNSCKIVSQLNCAPGKWQCIDDIPARVVKDGTIEFLNQTAWDQSQPNMAENCRSFIATMNMPNLPAFGSNIYENLVSTCTQECSDQSSSCYHALVNMPVLNNCQPSITSTVAAS